MAKRQYMRHSGIPRPYHTMSAGIYAIVNRNSGKMYVGSARVLNHRWGEHRGSLQKNKHHSPYLQRAFNKDPEAFYIEVIEELDNPTKEVLLAHEQFWLDFYRVCDPDYGYNVSPTAESCHGIKRSPEMIAKMSAANKGKKFSAARLEIHRNRKRPTKFRSFTPEQRAAASRRVKGTKASPETIAKRTAKLKANPPHQRPVLQFDFQGKFIARFPMITTAEETVSGTRLGIASACSGRVTHSGGFQWRYEDQLKNPEHGIGPKPNRRWKPTVGINQYDKQGVLIGSYASVLEAGRRSGVHESAIRAASKRGKNPFSGGYRWERIKGESHGC